MYSRRVWLLWLVGAAVLLCIAEVEPSVLAYLADPELLAGTVVVAALIARRGVGRLGRAGGAVVDHLFWYQLNWPKIALQYLRERRNAGESLFAWSPLPPPLISPGIVAGLLLGPLSGIGYYSSRRAIRLAQQGEASLGRHRRVSHQPLAGQATVLVSNTSDSGW